MWVLVAQVGDDPFLRFTLAVILHASSALTTGSGVSGKTMRRSGWTMAPQSIL